MRMLGTLTALIALVAISLPASATPLNTSLSDEPDIFSAFITVNYDNTTDSFTATGIAVSLTINNVTTPIDGGLFSLWATIDEDGVLGTGGAAIEGTVGGLGLNLLTGTIAEFGFNSTPGESPDPYEFLLDTTGGDLAGLIGPQFGLILTLTSQQPSNPPNGTIFSDDITAHFAGVADIAPIPEPSTVLSMGLGLAMLAHQGRRRGAKRS